MRLSLEITTIQGLSLKPLYVYTFANSAWIVLHLQGHTLHGCWELSTFIQQDGFEEMFTKNFCCRMLARMRFTGRGEVVDGVFF